MSDRINCFSHHGKLSVSGNRLVDEHGEAFRLFGMSTHGIAWHPQWINLKTFRYLRDVWNTNCIRLALYTYEYGGYCSGGDRQQLKDLICKGVSYAEQLDMYVIIDWHVLNEKEPMLFAAEVVEFFDEMSGRFKGCGNVIYEICNEPNTTATWQSICEYADRVIPVIRRNAPDSVIIVGTPVWSQRIDEAAKAPLGYDDLLYSLHFYAATHGADHRERLESCMKEGLPVIISEFGITAASGDRPIDIVEAEAWKALIEKHGLSFICWNLSSSPQECSILADSCKKLYGWSDSDLKQQGIWVRDWFKSIYYI